MNELFEFYRPIDKVKHIERKGWRAIGVQGPVDTIGTHSFGAPLIGWVLGARAQFDDNNMLRLIKMLLLHDLVMAYMPDYLPEDASYERKRQIENEAGQELLRTVPEGIRQEFAELFTDYQAETSDLAQFARQCDKLDTLLQALIYSEQLKRDGLSQFIDSYRDKFTKTKPEAGRLVFEELQDVANKLKSDAFIQLRQAVKQLEQSLQAVSDVLGKWSDVQ